MLHIAIICYNIIFEGILWKNYQTSKKDEIHEII